MLAVTGITGHTGGFFLSELEKSHYDGKIRCLVRTPSKAGELLNSKLGIEIVEGSLTSEADVRALLFGADVVVHIAGIHYSPEILRIGKECGVKRFILVHTTGMYSKFKAASQEYIRIEHQIAPVMQELNVTVLRPTMIFGDMCDYNISKFIRFVDRLPILPVVAGGKALVQPVNARDLAKVLYKTLDVKESAGEAYDISGEKAISIRQMYEAIGSCLGKKRFIVSVPMGVCVLGANMVRLISSGRIDLVEKVQRLGEDRAYSHEKAEKELGYVPEPFLVGLQREVDEYSACK